MSIMRYNEKYHVSRDEQVASCEETAGLKYDFGGRSHPRGILLARATHSFQLCASPGVVHTRLYSVLAARLAAHISWPRDAPAAQGLERKDDKSGRRQDEDMGEAPGPGSCYVLEAADVARDRQAREQERKERGDGSAGGQAGARAGPRAWWWG